MRWRRLIPLCLVLALDAAHGPGLLCQEIRVRASVEPTRVAEGEQVVLAIEITGSNQAADEPPDLTHVPGFVLASGPAVSSLFQWINGRTSASRTYRYTLVPQAAGVATIPAIIVNVEGRPYRTEPVTVEVVPRGGGAPSGPTPPRGPSPFADPGLRRQLAPAVPKPQSIFVEAQTDKSEVYPGEQVSLSYRVYTQFEIAQISLQDQPTYQGFWAEDLKVGPPYDPRTVNRAEGTFMEYTILRKALFPTNPGTLTIPPLTFHFSVRRRGMDPFDSFFFQPTESVFRSSETVRIRVKPLPEEGRPPDFSGAVGRYTLQVSTDLTHTRVNDAVDLKVQVEGQGNISTLGPPSLPPLEDFRRYEPRTSETAQAKGGTLVGEKTWDYVLIPLAAGRQEIPPVRFSFFDPTTAQYRILQSDPITLQVAKGDLAEFPVQVAPERAEIPVLGSDIRYIKLAGGRIENQGETLFGSPAFAFLLVFPFVVNASLLVVTRRRAARAGNEMLLRRRRARRRARKRLSRSRSSLAPEHFHRFYQELASALTSYLADKAGVTAAGLTYDRIEEILSTAGVEMELRDRFRRCLETCDFARFAPTSMERGEMERTLAEASAVIEGIEGRVRAT